MTKSGRQYADEVRELRAAGFDFPAARGYRLADAANWSRGLKSAVTRAVNSTRFDPEPDGPFEGFDGEEFDEEFFFEQAEDLEDFEFSELADLDEPWDEFLDDIIDDFDAVEETDYEDTD